MSRVTDPASFGGAELCDADRACGGAFVLDEVAASDATVDAGDGWLVEVRAGALVVVARGSGASTAEDAHGRGLDAAQRGLDLLSFKGAGDLIIGRAEDEHLAWWVASDQRRVLRATSVAPLRITVEPITAKVLDSSGNERLLRQPEPSWHPSLRYFRLAQVAEEVFDAYRNLFLAVESILSTATPPQPGERDFDWLRRALQAAGAAGANIAGYAEPEASDRLEAIRGDLYSEVRTATFHAKHGARTLLPLDALARRAVIERLSRLAGLYLELVHVILGFRRLGGAMYKGGFDLMVKALIPELSIAVTDDEVRVDETATSVNPGGGRVKSLKTRPSPELDQPFLRSVIGEAPVSELRELTRVSRLASVHRDGSPVTAGQLEALLTLGGFDTFEAVMGIRGINSRLPKTSYAA